MVASMIFCAAGPSPFRRSRLQNRVVMSMQPQPWPQVPAETAGVASSAFRKGTLAMRARDELGERQRTDSTHVLGRIRGLNRLELAGETVRAALEALAAAAPGWLAGVIDGSWQQTYGQRIDQIRLPVSEAARGKLAVQYGKDGYHLLEAVSAPGAPGWLPDLPAVQALRQIWVQQYYRSSDEHGEKVVRREDSEHGLQPAATPPVPASTAPRPPDPPAAPQPEPPSQQPAPPPSPQATQPPPPPPGLHDQRPADMKTPRAPGRTWTRHPTPTRSPHQDQTPLPPPPRRPTNQANP
jgi:hypothetical protein